jgi:hypothetical protein
MDSPHLLLPFPLGPPPTRALSLAECFTERVISTSENGRNDHDEKLYRVVVSLFTWQSTIGWRQSRYARQYCDNDDEASLRAEALHSMTRNSITTITTRSSIEWWYHYLRDNQQLDDDSLATLDNIAIMTTKPHYPPRRFIRWHAIVLLSHSANAAFDNNVKCQKSCQTGEAVMATLVGTILLLLVGTLHSSATSCGRK